MRHPLVGFSAFGLYCRMKDRNELGAPALREAVFHDSAARDKNVLIIAGANHNDMMWIGKERYFQAIKEFAST